MKLGGFPVTELWGNDCAVCPYCKKANDNENMGYDEQTDSMECEYCNKKFYFHCRIRPVFDTVGDCELNGETKHTLKIQFPKDLKHYRCTKCQQEFYDWQLPGGQYPKLEEGEYEIVEGDESFI